ncbi:pentatricopeptide repeat-containing protein 2, mitochondrial isoform X2 [Xenopus tropicalis]|uniref:Pentatricopeptide repeat-containing protein 2, mitochondrial n=1 Tax=Xenopus tropicalis TaxID=8364 RepID=A0A6I8SAD5_XENTR|nr:pentatricopeptide repeat-containing protein 2, mitochondrial isoform X2 [Xenopus tropicalis]|eukprot:XP_004910868.1 PREDICTED: pentatricopeptide repeat-containing protein 2, mitochondrial isoform X2 [Xenopus tropicalis]
MALLGSWTAQRWLLENGGRSLLRAGAQLALCCSLQAKRYLLTDDILKLHEFQKKKLTTLYQIYGKKDLYFQTIEEKLQRNGIILRDELKTLLHLCSTQPDVEFAKRVIYRYHEENKNVMFGEFRFGPVFLRLCYELDLEDIAVELLKDKTLHGFFSDCTSFNILMDMLFTKGQYERAVEVLVQMRNQRVRFSKETYILAFAICYKLEEFVKARKLYSQIMNTDSKLCNNLLLLIKVHTSTVEDVLQFLEAAAQAMGSKFVKKTEFAEELLAATGQKLKSHTELYTRFNIVYHRLKDAGQISGLTLDQMLCYTPPELTRSNLHLIRNRKTSRRTFRSLQSTLLVE